jgi:two-component system response regulator MprA
MRTESAQKPAAETKPRVAIVDDERHVRELLELSLGRHGYETRSAADGQSGLQVIREWRPDAVILDVMMPKLDGLSLLPMIRNVTESPVLMLSALGDVNDRVTGLSRGADDYIAKPFDVEELLVRIAAALRRPHLANPQRLAFADLEMEVVARTVRRAQRTVRLTAREFDLLYVLLRHPRRIFSREHLLDRVWGDRDVMPGCVDTYVSYLRAKIDAAGQLPLIHTIRGAGYTLRDTA